MSSGSDLLAGTVLVDATNPLGPGLTHGLGWEPLDAGPLAAALDLEHLTLLWVRMVRGGGLDPRLTWAALRGGAG